MRAREIAARISWQTFFSDSRLFLFRAIYDPTERSTIEQPHNPCISVPKLHTIDQSPISEDLKMWNVWSESNPPSLIERQEGEFGGKENG